MSNQTVYALESANLICGDTSTKDSNKGAPGISTHLVLQELKLPTLEENYVDHTPGGTSVGIEIPSHTNKLEATFNLAGWSSDVMAYLSRETTQHQRFTAYGLIRDRRSSLAHQCIAVMWGRLGRVNPTAFSKGNLMHHEYSIKSIVHYELRMQEQAGDNANLSEIYFWDFFTSEKRIGGIDVNREMVRLLAIPGNPTDATTGGAGAGGF
jgi:hypothetical protein